MKRNVISALMVAAAVWMAPGAPAGLLPAGMEIMESRELRPGMEGYGLSVFAGTEPEKFGVKILGVVPNWWAGGDMILAELDHPVINGGGVVAGMSGSPVYIDGKLIGAVAYGWGFSRRPVGGITPISKMLEVMEQITEQPNLPPTEWTAGLATWPEARAAMGLGGMEPTTPLPPAVMRELGLPAEYAGMTLQPLGTPLYVSTRHDAVMQHLGQYFGGSALHPVQAGGGAPIGRSVMNAPEYDGVKPVDGGALAVVLVEGDLSIAGVGTITLVGEDRLVAYGHAGFGTGSVDAPAAVANVTTIIPSMMFPFKLGFPVKEIGSLREDRQFAVGAHLGARTAMVPVKFRMVNNTTSVDETYNYGVWNDRTLMPVLVATCLIESAVSSLNKFGGPATAVSTMTIELANGRTVEKNYYHSGTGLVPVQAALALFQDLQLLVGNRFEPAEVRQVHGTMHISEQRQVMVLERLVRHRTRVYPGGRIEGSVQYARWREEPVVVDFAVPVPEHLPAGEYELRILDGRTRTSLELAARPELSHIESFDDMVDRIEPNFADDSIYFMLVAPQERLLIRNNRMEDLPTSVAAITEATARDPRQTVKANGRIVAEESRRFDAQVAGSTTVPIVVRERN